MNAQFLHSPIAAPGERARILARAAQAVAPGGALLVVSHQSMPPWHPAMPEGLTDRPLDLTVPTPAENRSALGIDEAEWETVLDDVVALAVTSPSGEPGLREDHVLQLRRRAARL